MSGATITEPITWVTDDTVPDAEELVLVEIEGEAVSVPTGKLKFAYDSIAKLEQQIATLRAQLAAAEARAERLARSLRECVEDTDAAIQHHLDAFGETYKPHRLKALRDQAAEARAALAEGDVR